MNRFARLASGSGSFAVNAALLLAFELTEPLDPGRLCAAPPNPPVVILAAPWRPYIDNPGEDLLRPDRQPRCPQPAGLAGGVRLDWAPLPPGYEPNSSPDRPMFGCVRVDARGRITAVRLIGGAGSAPTARLARTIRRDWRFRVEPFGPSEATWQRVRLNSGAVDEPVWDPPALM